MTLFCLSAAFLFIALACYRQRYAFYILIALFPLLPAYVAIPLVQGGAGISLQRILIYEMALVTTLSILVFPKQWQPLFRRIAHGRTFVAMFVLLSLSKMISTIHAGNSIGLVYFLDEIFMAIVPVILALRYATSVLEWKRIFLILFSIYSLVICAVYVEQYIGRPILSGFVSIEVSTVGESVLEGRFRDGEYRIMGFFDNPLSLSEYLVIGLPFLIAAFVYRQGIILASLTVFLYLPAIYFTGSRSAWLVLFGAILSASYLYVGGEKRGEMKILHSILMYMVMLIVVIISYDGIHDPGMVLTVVNEVFPSWGPGEYSVIERLTQYIVIPAAIIGNGTYGLLGAGMQSGFIEGIGTNLDSYYLRLLIEGGIIADWAFIMMLVYAIHKSSKPSTYLSLPQRFRNETRFIMLVFFISFALYKFFVSTVINFSLFYLLTGMLMAISCASVDQVRRYESYPRPQ